MRDLYSGVPQPKRQMQRPKQSKRLWRVSRLGRAAMLWLLAVCGSVAASAQNSGVFNRYATPPDVWRPAQISEPGVDARGDLNLEVPLLTIPGRNGLAYPVQLRYASGIRYDQPSSWVGGGWNFDPGSITRDVQSVVLRQEGENVPYNVDFTAKPPAQPDHYYLTVPEGGSAMVRSGPIGIQQRPPRGTPPPTDFYLTEWRAWRINVTASNEFPYGNGQQNNPVVVGGSRTGIGVADQADFARFVVTSENGTRYVFERPAIGTYRGMNSSFTPGPPERHVAVWRLVAILGTDFVDPLPTTSQWPAVWPADNASGSWVRLIYGTFVASDNDGGACTATSDCKQAYYLTEIVTPTHRAAFTTVPRGPENFPPWQEIAGLNHRLAEIALYARSSGQLVRRVVLHSTPGFESPLQETCGVPVNCEARLRLDEVRMYNRSGSREPGYAFTYMPRASGTSTPQNVDHFGYYDTVGGYEGNFNLNTVDGASWSLATIRYPTGGWDVVEYENDEVPSQSIPFNIFNHTTGQGGGNTYLLPADATRQGGARVTRISRYDGVQATPSVVTYTYPAGGGRLSGIPPRHWDYLYTGRGVYLPAERGRAAVYYDTISRTEPDGSTVVTSYTTDVSHPSQVRRLETLAWLAGGDVGSTIIQGNQDWNWGRPYSTEYREGSNLVRRMDRTYALSAAPLYLAWTATPAAVAVEWGFANRVTREVDAQHGAAGSAPTERTYTYFDATGAFDSQSAGNGLVRTVDVHHTDGRRRRTTYTYAYEKYAQLATAHRLDAVALESVALINGGTPPPPESVTQASSETIAYYQSATATTWQAFIAEDGSGCTGCETSGSVSLFEPHQTFAWNDASLDPTTRSYTPFMAWTGGGQAGWQLKETTEGYNFFAQPLRVRDGRGSLTTLSYDTGGRLARVEIPTGQGVTLLRTYTWDTDFDALASVGDEYGRSTLYRYDDAGRLSEVVDRTGTTVAEYAYQLACAPTPCTGTGTIQPNRVRTTRFTGGSPTSYRSFAFYDGLGRLVQTQDRDAGAYVITTTEYVPSASVRGHVERAWKPYREAGGAYRAGFADEARVAYGATTNPYTDTERTSDGTGRTRRIVYPHSAGETPPARLFQYGTEVPSLGAAPLSFTTETDEDGEVSRTLTDAWGHDIVALRAVGTPFNTRTETVFDLDGRPREVRQPNTFDLPPGTTAADFVTTYAYDTQGRLLRRANRDAGEVRFLYDAADNLRYVQDANRRAEGRVRYVTYDAAGRPLVTGVRTASFDALDPTAAPPTAETAYSADWLTVHRYDALPATGTAPWSFFASDIAGSTVTNPIGRPVATLSRSDGVWQLEMSGYDAEERLTSRRVRTLSAGDGSAIDSPFNTDLGYTYNAQGQLLTRTATLGTTTFRHWYNYDARGMTHEVRAAPAARPSTADVSFTYHPTGMLATRAFAGSPVAPLTYDLRDRLISIGYTGDDASLAGQPFTAQYTYHIDGTVATTRFGYKPPDQQVTGTTGLVFDTYTYTYDALDRLRNASIPGNAHAYAGIRFDRNGNLTEFVRRDAGGAVIDRLAYTYSAGGNRVSQVTDASAPTAAPWDVESGLFAYDSNGNATYLPPPYEGAVTYDAHDRAVAYDVPGQPRYRYASDGQRYWRRTLRLDDTEEAGGATEVLETTRDEYTVLDGLLPSIGTRALAGVAVRGGNLDWHVLAPSGEALAQQPSSGSRVYFHKDLLGSPRALTSPGGALVATRGYDAFGVAMGHRSAGQPAGGGLHVEYTGKDRDEAVGGPLSGLDDFGARWYASALGRFLQTDPLWEKHIEWSPYAYVLGNPLILLDPDGQQTVATEFTLPREEREYGQGRLSREEWQGRVRARAAGATAGVAVLTGAAGAASGAARIGLSGAARWALSNPATVVVGGREVVDFVVGATTGAPDPQVVGGGTAGQAVRQVGRAVTVGEFRLTQTVANHLDDVITRRGSDYFGERARPFLTSPNTIREIMRAGRPVADPGGLRGALRWDVPGSFRGVRGTWELVVRDNVIYHFNFTN